MPGTHDRRAFPAIASSLVAAALVTVGAAAGGPVAQPAPTVVLTGNESLRGRALDGMRSFLGVPYAAAPVGALRWRPPQPPPSWTGERSATAFRSACPQTASLFWPGSTEEDCLFLNVFTPPVANSGTGYPVMVWIHGGGLVSGASSAFLPTRLVARNVVVVTVDYRLGVLGFLAHHALSAESPARASGNYGLLDQQSALRWVRRNIARFGGDPHEVTLFGESAGGLSVHVQLASPTAAGLFQRAVVQSGGYAGSQPSLPLAEAAGAAFAARLGCGATSAACLRRVPVATLLANGAFFEPTPVVDGRLLTRPLTDAFRSGRFNRVPVIEGSNRDEFRFFLAAQARGAAGSTAAGYRAAIAATLGVEPSVAARIAARYPLRRYPAPVIALAAVATDAVYACRAHAAAQALSHFVPTYQYEFADESAPRFFPGPPPRFPLGAYHTAELGYLFGLRGFPAPLTGGHAALAQAMVDLWTTFARTGDPGAGWLPTSGATDAFEVLSPPSPAAGTGFAAAHDCPFWSRTPVAAG
jgi:para-nitrobenzyl esterase